MIEIDTESTLYVCTDGANAEVHLFIPAGGVTTACVTQAGGFAIDHLRIDDPDPYGPHGSDAAVFKLLCESDMEHHTFDL
jgi:hypothetical protein